MNYKLASTTSVLIVASCFNAGCGGSGAVTLPLGLVGDWTESPDAGRNFTLQIRSNGVVHGGSADVTEVDGLVDNNGNFTGQVNYFHFANFLIPVTGTISFVGTSGDIRVKYEGHTSGTDLFDDATFTRL